MDEQSGPGPETVAPGKFIVFEGIDGTGKSTISRMVVKDLVRRGIEAVWTCEPGEGLKTRLLEGVIDTSDPVLTTLHFLIDRAEHNKQIQKWMAEGKTVVCDRYLASTFAYQGPKLTRAMGKDALNWLAVVQRPVTVTPSAVILLDLDLEAAMGRIGARGGKQEEFEEKHMLQEAREIYLNIAQSSQGWTKIRADLPVNVVFEVVMGRVLEVVL